MEVGPTLCFVAPHRRTDADTTLTESFKHHETVKTKGSYKDDIAMLSPTLPSPQTPASFAYRLDNRDGGSYEWMMITFVPDDAGVSASRSLICMTCPDIDY